MERSVANILLLVLSLGAALVVAGRPAGTSGEVADISHQHQDLYHMLKRSTEVMYEPCKLYSHTQSPPGTGGAADIRLPSDGKGLGADEKLGAMKKVLEEDERPWACCDDTYCLRMIPKVCGCRDVVTQCASACRFCNEVSPGRHVCQDMHEGWPGPKCTYEVDVAGAGN